MASTNEALLLAQVQQILGSTPQLIQTQTLGSPMSNAFFGPPLQLSTFARLTLFWQARLSATGQVDLLMQIDGVSSSSYLWAKNEAANGVVAGAHAGAATTAIKIGVVSGDNANYAGSGKQEIEGWQNTALYLTCSGHYSNFDSATTDWAGVAGGTYLATGPHVSVKVFPSAGNFGTGSTFSLYGSN